MRWLRPTHRIARGIGEPLLTAGALLRADCCRDVGIPSPMYEPVGPVERAARQETGRWIEPEDTKGLNGWLLPKRGIGVRPPRLLRSWFGLLGMSAAYALIVRPRINRWGATDEEVRARLPGDELPALYGDRVISNRAITIEAAPEEIWPWLVQMGSGRAGFYTHEWVERLLGVTYAESHSSNRIHPEWQALQAGDRVAYSRFNSVPVDLVDPPRCLVAGEWLVLRPIDGGTGTRLIARTRGGWLEPFARRVPLLWPLLLPLAVLVDRGPGELLHHYMEAGMLEGIKIRAEAATHHRPEATS